jgi:DNA gyrase subunit A
MMLDDNQSVIAMLVSAQDTPALPDGTANPDLTRTSVLTATENGYGKRTPIDEYTRHGRGTKGMIAIQQSERNGRVVAATLVHGDDTKRIHCIAFGLVCNRNRPPTLCSLWFT